MARQKGIIKLKGSIGDVSFYKTKDGYLAREKSGVDKDRIKNDPAFQRTRENGAEFTHRACESLSILETFVERRWDQRVVVERLVLFPARFEIFV